MRNNGHQLTLLKGSTAYFAALIEAIDVSVHEVRLETYIFHPEASVVPVAQALVRAAERGVQVFLACDGAGTPEMPALWREQFAQAGVQWRIFRPLGWFGLVLPSRWRRLHRKLCVVDGQVAFCGGINLLDDWLDPNHGVLAQPRLDFAVRVSGPLVRWVHAVMAQFWWRLQATRRVREVDWAGAWEALQQAVQASRLLGHTVGVHSQSAHAELVLRDNVRHRVRIERTYRHAIGLARHEVLLANAYFVPGRKMRNALIHAVRRGVRVRLLLQGRYEYFMQLHATRALYDTLLAAGIEIYEYRSSFLHAKVAVIDGHWVTVGSSNIDPLSLLLAREANVVVDDAGFAKALQQDLEQALSAHAQRVDPHGHARRAWPQRWLDQLAYGLMRVILFLIGQRY
jgi:cardiolipin synthase